MIRPSLHTYPMKALYTTILFLFIATTGLTGHAQVSQQPFKGTFVNKNNKMTLVLDLYEVGLEAPGLEFLGKVGAYLSGKGVYGTWLLTSHRINGKKAILRMSNDTGSDAQTIELTQLNDSTFNYRTVGGNEIKKAQGRKLVKTPSQMLFTRMAQPAS